MLGDAHRGALKAHPLQAAGRQKVPGQRQVAPLPAGEDHLRPGHLLLGRLNVPPVGGILAPIPGHQDIALPLEAHGVALAGLADDQHGVQIVLRQLVRNLAEMVHGVSLLSPCAVRRRAVRRGGALCIRTLLLLLIGLHNLSNI